MDQFTFTEKSNYLHKKYKIAYSSLPCNYIDDILALALYNDVRLIEWDLNFIPPILNNHRKMNIMNEVKSHGIEIRYHLPYSFVDIAHHNKIVSDWSLDTLYRYLDFIHELNGEVAVMHVGQDYDYNLSYAIKNSEYLIRYAASLNIKVCIENIITGLTTNIVDFEQILSIPNMYLCFDVGHAKASGNGSMQYYDLIKNNLSKCIHSHIYETEKSYQHIPFANIQNITKHYYFNLLLKSNCVWLTMELETTEQQIQQMKYLNQILCLN